MMNNHLDSINLMWAFSQLCLVPAQEALCGEEKELLGLASPAMQAGSGLHRCSCLKGCSTVSWLPEPSATPACCCTHSSTRLHTFNRPAGTSQSLASLAAGMQASNTCLKTLTCRLSECSRHVRVDLGS